VIIRAGSKIFLDHRIVAIETRSNPRQRGWPEETAAAVLVDSGTNGQWIALDDTEWIEFQKALQQSIGRQDRFGREQL